MYEMDFELRWRNLLKLSRNRDKLLFGIALKNNVLRIHIVIDIIIVE